MPDGKGGEKYYFCKEANRLCIGAVQIQTLKKIGLNCERLKFNKFPQRDASQFCRVVSIERIENEETVYCFNDPKNHTGIFNGIMTGQCGEAVSDTDSDSCNLGTVFISKFTDRDDFERCVKYATKLLICGNLYSDYPLPEMREVALKNNRIGLGLGGIHDWLIQRGEKYHVSTELFKWLSVYERMSDESAHLTANEIGTTIPLNKRAIAPTGTIGCISGSTTGIEPIFCKAYKRHYYKGNDRVYEYVVDPVIKRMIDQGIDVTNVQDSYDIPFIDRVKMQADTQQFVDMAISSTCNLPKWGTENNNEDTLVNYSKILLKYAKRLRGFTTYPNESRGGQPLERVTIEEALNNQNKVFESNLNSCKDGVCGA
jgi:ribonucleoside-diphosphate reductase alpha chain